MKQNKVSRAPSQRQLRVGEVIRHALAEILQRGDVHDPVFEGTVVTVPEVRMAADLKCATVYLMPLGGKNSGDVVAAFDRNKKYIRGEVARRVNLRAAPDLRFRLDTSFDVGAKIDAVLRSPDVTRDLNGHANDDNAPEVNDSAAPDEATGKDAPRS
jgi:ribosome-binding factor A